MGRGGHAGRGVWVLTLRGWCVVSASGVRLYPPALPSGTPRHHSRDVRIGFCDACFPPRDWLQRLQTVRVLSRVSSPPCAWGTMWSASALLGSRDTS